MSLVIICFLQGMLQSVLRIPLDQVTTNVEPAMHDERDNKSKGQLIFGIHAFDLGRMVLNIINYY